MSYNMNDIVISGMSGRFPESDNIEELARQLYEGVDLITEDDRRWPQGLWGLPKGIGKIKNLAHFDAEFFNVTGRQASLMDPQVRLLLETTYEGLVDAGINVQEFRGSNTGVFTAASLTNAKEILSSDPNKIQGYEMMGCLPAFFANHISQSFDFKGPSMNIDNGCASSVTAIVQGLTAIRSGQCDAAIVGGVTINLLPTSSLSLCKVLALSSDARCRSFTASASGYVRSDGVVTVVLQRRAAAKRIYATIKAARINNDGYRPQGFSFPSKEMQSHLAEEILKDAGIRPEDISFFETHGTATKIGDAQELNAIAETYCSSRSTPLLVGSIKSNMGHSESASGLCSLVKILISMEKGVIPGNLHFDVPNPDVPALIDGRFKIVDQNTKWNGGIAAVNCFGFGGSNGCVILESEPNIGPLRESSDIPRLIVASGRTEEAVKSLLELGYKCPDDANLHGLLDAIHTNGISGHSYRGYTLTLDKFQEEITVLSNNKRRSIWFAFTTIGQGLYGRLNNLMKLPVFASTIKRLAETLKPNGIDLVDDFKSVTTLETINSTVIQVASIIAIVDVFKSLKIKPDVVLGASIGEIGCAYADGLLSAEQAILCSYWCGKYVDEPHSRAMIHTHIENCITTSNHIGRWLSADKLRKDWGKVNFADHFLKSAESTKLKLDLSVLPDDAIIIEIGSNFVLLNESLKNKPNSIHIPLINSDGGDLCHTFLMAVGRLFNAGLQPQISNLYPQIKWPVPKGTPSLSSHVIWDHSTQWHVPHYSDQSRHLGNRIEVDLTRSKYYFLSDCNIDGKILFPVAGYLVLVWKTFVQLRNLNIVEDSIEFENMEFIMTTELSDAIEFSITILPQSGKYELCVDGNIVATGIVRVATDNSDEEEEEIIEIKCPKDKLNLPLDTEDVYKELKLRGYNYNGLFKGIRSTDALQQSGKISWKQNWISFLETIFQFDILGSNTRELYLPSFVKKISINPKTFKDDKDVDIVKHEHLIKTEGIKVEGIQWTEINRHDSERTPKFEKYVFCPYYSVDSNDDYSQTLQTAFKICLQIILENSEISSLNIAEIINDDDEFLYLPIIQDILSLEPHVQYSSMLVTISKNQVFLDAMHEKNIKVVQTDTQYSIPEKNCNLIVAQNVLTHSNAGDILHKLISATSDVGMILMKESADIDIISNLTELFMKLNLVIISRQIWAKEQLILLRRTPDLPKEHAIIDISDKKDYLWVDELRSAMKLFDKRDSRIYLVARDYDSGILGLSSCLRKEAGGHKIRSYFLPGCEEHFSLDSSAFSKMVKKDLVFNVLTDDVWGSYKHLMMKKYTANSVDLNNQTPGTTTILSSLVNNAEKEESICPTITPKVFICHKKSYIIVGGLGGFGLELAKWLVERGATKLVINSRSDIKTGYQAYCIRRLRQKGIDVLISTDDAATNPGAKGLLQKAIELGPLGGIFNLALVLQDAVLENQSPESFNVAGKAKIEATTVLDTITREMALEIDHFVVFSSIIAGRGSYGQTNYGFANSSMERIIERRHQDGLAGLAIQWGPIDEVGILTRIVFNHDQLFHMSGAQPQTIRSCLDALDVLLVQEYPVVGSCVPGRPTFDVKKLTPKNLCKQIADIFGIKDLNKVSKTMTLEGLGMDSIIAAEVTLALKIDHDISLNLNDIQQLTFEALEKMQ